jgi:hypothetical protein
MELMAAGALEAGAWRLEARRLIDKPDQGQVNNEEAFDATGSVLLEAKQTTSCW